MKFKALSLGLLSLSAISASALVSALIPSSAHAQCVAVNAPTQIAINGYTDETNQQSAAYMAAEEDCFGSTTTYTGTQVFTGPGDVNQVQNSTHYLGGTYEGPYEVPSSDPLFFNVPTQVEVDVLPYDPAFQNYYGTPYSADDYS